jgi:tRNA-dihydrouridine synthase B
MARAPLPPIAIGGLQIWPPLLLAPMAGATDSVLRILCKRQSAGLVCTELTSSHGLYHGNEKSYRFLRWTEEERPISAQIFGAVPQVMREAARVVSDAGADLIDINMGCWVPKVAKTGAGAALLKDLPLAAAVMRSVVEGASVPVTVKTRMGWDGCTGSAVELARVAEDVGVAAIAVHGRFARQGFDGQADWRPIAEVREAVSIPVFGNGDVRTPQDAARMFEETRCHGVMIGRAALGDPWIFRRVLTYLETGVVEPEPEPVERLEMALRHARMLARQECGPDARRDASLPGSARSQIIHYLKGIPGAATTREQLVRVRTLGEIEDALEAMLEIAGHAGPPTPLGPGPSDNCLTFAASDGILTPN